MYHLHFQTVYNVVMLVINHDCSQRLSFPEGTKEHSPVNDTSPKVLQIMS